MRDLTAEVLGAGDGAVATRLAAWQASHASGIARTVRAVKELTEGSISVARLSVAAGLLADLAREA